MGITYDKYQEMIEGMPQNEIDLLPPPPIDFAEFPYEAQEAFRMFSILPDIVSDAAGFIGKDINSLPWLYTLYEVPEYSHKPILDIMIFMSQVVREKTREKMKQSSKKPSGPPVKNITSKKR
jgi:hypothetical protein